MLKVDRAHSLAIGCRHISLNATRHRPPLSEDKLRALVSLYHQSDSFITLENLSERIDEAFVGRADTGIIKNTSVKDLTTALELQRDQAKISQWEDPAKSEQDTGQRDWSAIKMGREMRVKQALFGLSNEGNLPGIEVLKDAVTKEGKLPKRLESDVRDLLED
ncbi:hypothetical protein H0H87_001220 [Tephrocybe sp. NHM501043]|nr:hypothetical protein H0H87_001220 [Tephrocybe sp. NHM501043]